MENLEDQIIDITFSSYKFTNKYKTLTKKQQGVQNLIDFWVANLTSYKDGYVYVQL